MGQERASGWARILGRLAHLNDAKIMQMYHATAPPRRYTTTTDMSPELARLFDQITILQIEISDARRKPKPSPRLLWDVWLTVALLVLCASLLATPLSSGY